MAGCKTKEGLHDFKNITKNNQLNYHYIIIYWLIFHWFIIIKNKFFRVKDYLYKNI